MSKKRRQHFVPVFYIKRFSTDSESRRINLFHIEKQKLIPNVSLKSQAQKDNFYGLREIEEALSLIEGRTAEVFSDMITNNRHPKYFSPEHHVILTFTLFLNLRTIHTAEEVNEMVDRLTKKVFSRDPLLNENLDDYRFGYEHPAQAALGHIGQLLPLTFDLGFKLLVNQTHTPFITSDHPVALYNQLFQRKKKLKGGNIGFAAKGLQIFLPISPKHLIMLYDKEMYKVGGIKHKPVYINNSNDIDTLNGIQYLNANVNLYFNQEVSEIYIQKLIKRFSKYRRKGKTFIEELYLGETTDGKKCSATHLSRHIWGQRSVEFSYRFL